MDSTRLLDILWDEQLRTVYGLHGGIVDIIFGKNWILFLAKRNIPAVQLLESQKLSKS